MNYNMRIEDAAHENLPHVTSRNSGVDLHDGQVVVRMGDLFEATVDRGLVTGARTMDDPRPSVFLAMGVSSAVDQLGDDTLAVVGSHEGLVSVDFGEMVEARKRVPQHEDADEEVPEVGTVHFRHLILSLEEPEEFVRAIGGR